MRGRGFFFVLNDRYYRSALTPTLKQGEYG